MHRNIVINIRNMIDMSPYDDISYRIFDNEPSTGFWQMEITFHNGVNSAHTASLKKIIKYIGLIFGESVFIDEISENKIHIK